MYNWGKNPLPKFGEMGIKNHNEWGQIAMFDCWIYHLFLIESQFHFFLIRSPYLPEFNNLSSPQFLPKKPSHKPPIFTRSPIPHPPSPNDVAGATGGRPAASAPASPAHGDPRGPPRDSGRSAASPGSGPGEARRRAKVKWWWGWWGWWKPWDDYGGKWMY